MTRRIPVAIVGAGPVGTALAVDLGLRGVRCALIESRAAEHRIPKGQMLAHRTLEHFHFWGLAGELRAARLMPPGYPIGEITAYGSLLGEYWQAPAGRELVRPYYFQDYERLPQYCTEAVLRRKLAALPGVESFFGWTARQVSQDGHAARVRLEQDGGARAEVLEADYVVGCDGGHSLVREQAGIGRAGTDFRRTMVLAVFRSRELHEKLKRFPERSTFRVMRPGLEGYWLFFGRVDVGESWFFHAPLPPGEDASRCDIPALIRDAVGSPVQCEFDHVGSWDLRVAVAERYRERRLFLAGDAAHSHPPYGAFGLNNGLEDAVNLGWKLQATLAGWGGERLLESYDAERRPVFRDIGENFIAARIRKDGEFFSRHDPARDRADFERAWRSRESDIGSRFQDYEPNYEGSPVVAGPAGGQCSAHGKHEFKARAGHHLAPQKLASGRDVFEELSNSSFNLLAFDADEKDVAGYEASAQSLRVPLKVVRDSGRDARAAYESPLVLVRPDQFVGWTGARAPGDPGALLRKLAGR